MPFEDIQECEGSKTKISLDCGSVDLEIPITYWNTGKTYEGCLNFSCDAGFGCSLQIGNDDKTLHEFQLEIGDSEMYALYMFLHRQIIFGLGMRLRSKAEALPFPCKPLNKEDVEKIIEEWRKSSIK